MEREATAGRQQNLLSEFVHLGKRSLPIFSEKDRVDLFELRSTLFGEVLCTIMADERFSANIIFTFGGRK